MDIAGIFDEVSQQMRSDMEKARKALSHSGLKGSANEEAFRSFLRDYLPQSLDISTGQIIDAHGSISRQMDVIISDAAKTPVFYRNGNTRIVPVECVYAVIEVKAKLDSAELEKVFQNMESVKNLKKTAYILPSKPGMMVYTNFLYGKEWTIWPTHYFVFAYDSIGLRDLAKTINERHSVMGLPEESRIDTVCVLDKGVICNKSPNGNYDALPQPGSRLIVSDTKRALLLFYTLTSITTQGL